ncbi:uncharacterized protein [Asterias amurensis]|uniref:uncharacterized protein n=1 Tax=Asterias amurensis TaxID=7602 RepID=UPI003AB5F521
MLTLKGHVTGSGPMGNPKQPRQPIKSWTSKTVKTSERSRQNGIMNSPRGLYNRGKIPLAAKLSVGGEWALKECEEHTTWLNGILKKHKSRPISDLRKSISDGLTLVNILEILFNSKIQGVQTRPIIRAQRLENINLCLRFLENRGVDIQHISADELTDSNLRATLALVTCLRKRFEAFHTSSSAHGGGSSTSIDKSIRPPTEISLQPSLGRDVSIHSFHSQLSIHSQHSDGSPARSKSTDIPAAIPSEHEEPAHPISPAPMNGDADLILPGTMADSDPDEPRPESADKPEATVIPTVTELDSQGVSQHGGGLRKQQFTGSPKKSFRPPVSRQRSSMDGEQSPVLSPVRDAVSQSVEERLKSLLDSPTPGRKFNRNISQQQPPIDDGELLEPPPPRRPSYANDDDNEEREATLEENKLQAMLEDPDNFEDYPKDWDRYVSGYVPSNSTEKMEGPRAQRLLDRQAAPPSQANSGQGRTLPFFHAPPTQHMGPLQTPSRMDNQALLMNGSQSLPIRERLSQGSMYSDDGRSNRPYDMQPPGSRFQMQRYRQEDESVASQSRTLPSYTDHIQRHPPKSRSSNPNNPNAMYVPEGSRQQSMIQQQQQQQRYPPDWQQPNRRGDQFQRWGPDYEQWQDFDQMAPDADHQRGRKYLNHMQNSGPLNQRGIPMEELSRRPDYHYGQGGGPNQDSKNPYIYLDRSSSDQRHQPYLMNGNILSSRDYAFTQSGSSSRSSTPPLPPLSPDNSDIDSTPSSPYFNKKSQRSVSVGVLPSRVQFPLYGPNDSIMGLKKRKGSTNRSTPSHKGFEPKSAARKSAGKGKRKIGKGAKSSSSLGPASETAPNKRKSPNNRALPTAPHLRQVNEHTENTDSDRSSHHSNQQPSDSEDSDLASQLSPLPSKSPLKITDAHQQSATESVEPPDPDNIRQQLVDLERMYNEILQVIGNDRKERLLENPGERGSVSSMSTTSGKTPNKSKAPSAKVGKRREKDIKQVNKRFARVESHVVTLARSVAHLSSELRSQNAMFHEIESLRHEINQIRDMQVLNASDVLNGGMRFRPIVPLCSNPNKIKKLTKFFGEEPPMLTMFLKDLGYEKYSSLFEKEGIGMVELPYLSEERLENIGVPIGPRLRILQEAQLMV